MTHNANRYPIVPTYKRHNELAEEAQNAASAAQRQREASGRLTFAGVVCGAVWGFVLVAVLLKVAS